MKPLWRTSIILTAIAGVTIIAILIFQKTNQPSIALTEEWIATETCKGEDSAATKKNKNYFYTLSMRRA